MISDFSSLTPLPFPPPQVIIIVMLIGVVIWTIVALIHHLQHQDEYLEKNNNNTTQYYIDMACWILSIISLIFLIVMVATEQLCGLLIALGFMIAIAAWYIYELNRKGQPLQAEAQKYYTIFYCVQVILIMAYCILLCFA